MCHFSKSVLIMQRRLRCSKCSGFRSNIVNPHQRYSSFATSVAEIESDIASEDSLAPLITISHDSEYQEYTSRKRPLIKLRAPRMQDNNKAPKRVNTKRRTHGEVVALFDACVATGNAPRALSLLAQIRSQTDDITTLRAANRYQHFVVEQVLKSSESTDQAWQGFHELRTRWKVEPDRTSYALLCKAILRLADNDQKTQQIRQVIHLWRSHHEDFGSVLAVQDVLSVSDCNVIFSLSGLDYRMIDPKHHFLLGDRQHPLTNVDEVIPTAQKGPGLRLVKHSLGVLTSSDPKLKSDVADYQLGGGQLAFNLARQRVLEENAVDAAVLRWRHEHEDMKKRGGIAYKRSLNAMFWEWKEQILPLIQEEISRIDHTSVDTSRSRAAASRDSRSHQFESSAEAVPMDEKEADFQVLTRTLNSVEAQRSRRDYGPFLGLLSPEKMAAVAILELIRSITTESVDGLKTALLAVKIGRAIENEYHSEVLKKRSSQELFQKTYREAVQSKKLFSMSVRQARSNAIKRQDMGLFTPEWTQSVRARIGALMLSFITYAARIPLQVTDANGDSQYQEVPALYHSYQYSKGQKLGVIKCNEQLIARLSSEPLKGSIYPRLLPMLAPPRPWYSWNSGGYLYTETIALRAKNCPEQIRYLKSASDRGLLDRVLTGLDVLGHTPWKINARVFQCALAGWNSGQAIADIPPAESEMDLPDPPAFDADPAVKFAYVERIREASAVVKNFASMRSDINYKLEIARAFLNDTMYFPHSLDFRGRAYPIPPHFNHLGNDLCRGLLQFGTGRELGQTGLRWLKIHLANQCGYDKASFEEREMFADQNMERIMEANDHPMDGTRWWLTVDKPWQCLATCFELTSAMRCQDPSRYVSSMPVHQDGTCNGLQHYAALGGDLTGAKQVNLEPSERPQDVYRGVADIVTAEIERDAAKGHPQAQLLKGHITRKLVKQTVMTNVYGVTWVGARLQIENQMKDMPVFKNQNIFDMASYAVNKVFHALKSMFTGAHEIQEWLRLSAQIITRSVHIDALLGDIQDPMTSVIWTSPLDLPIVQPYRKEVRRQIYTNLQTVFLSDPADAAEVNPKKQSSAFPPNFIHSLDATHMLMSAVKCKEEGIMFAAVHDSYWTHASDTDSMNVILRDAFIELHTRDLMADLASEFSRRYENHYSPGLQISRGSPAYERALNAAHLKNGIVKVLPKNKGIVIMEHDLAQEVLSYSSTQELESHKRSNRTQSEGPIESLPTPSIPTGSARVRKVCCKEDSRNNRGEGSWTIWTPMEFPPLPKKGDFDVRKIRQSKYFFS